MDNVLVIENHYFYDCGWKYDCYYYDGYYVGSNESEVWDNMKNQFGDVELEFVDIDPY